MKFKYYEPVKEYGSCVPRALSKALDKDYSFIKEELLSLSKKLGFNSYNEEEVFTKYLLDNGFKIVNNYKDTLVKNLVLDNNTYVIFCYKDDFYHMVTIIDNTLYDRNDDALNLKVIKIYERI